MDWGGLGWVRVGSLAQKWGPPGLQFAFYIVFFVRSAYFVLHCSCCFALQLFALLFLFCTAVVFALHFFFALQCVSLYCIVFVALQFVCIAVFVHCSCFCIAVVFALLEPTWPEL